MPEPEPAPAQPTQQRRRVTAAGFVLVVMGLGCMLLWIGVPAAGLWLTGVLSGSPGTDLPIALALILPGMFVAALGLAWLNDLYLRITGGEMVRVGPRRMRRQGPLEPMLAVCFFIALGALFFWFFLLAENPSRGVFG